MDRILVVSANLGDFERHITHVPQDVGYEHQLYTDKNFSPRFNSMTPRLQARIPKMMAWQMKPGYDYYIWIDSSCRLADNHAIGWFLEQLGDAEAAFFKHPHRNTVQEEADYLKERLQLEATGKKQKYILPRYENERIDDQMAVVDPEGELYASTAFIYRDTPKIRDLMTIWWLHTSLYHSIDQLSLTTAIKHSGAKVNVIPDNYLKVPWIEHVRNQ